MNSGNISTSPYSLSQPVGLTQNLRITNRIAVLLAFLSTALLLITISLFGVSVSTPITILAAVVYLGVIGFNYLGFINFSRILLCAFSPLVTLYITYILKLSSGHSDIVYYDSRILLLIFGIVPCLVFHTTEKIKLYSLLTLCLLSIVLFDPLHEVLGQGYYQKGFTGPSYYYINPICIITFTAITVGTLTLKVITEKAEIQKEKINQELEQKNKELQTAISEIETQNEEMQAQAEELRANHEKIEQANIIIQNQSAKLAEHNEKLGALVQEKSKELVKANEELVKHNGELRQFSYTVSHNLRAPIARLLGLTSLLENQQSHALPEDVKKIISHIRESSHEFDMIIRDLNKIIDIRNEIYRIKEKVILREEFEQVTKLIRNQVSADMTLETNFEQAPFIYTVRAVLNSIFYNMLTNAIKYRSPQRPLHVQVQSKIEGDFVKLEISDNGLGINLDSFGQDIFGLYKRFHTHTDGKGLGLYLVKSQVESLSGKIEVTSALNVGTSFYIYFKIPEEVEGQICFNSDYGTIFYNARNNMAGMVWKKPVTSEQYRTMFNKCYDIVRLYGTPYWISDIRKQGSIAVEDQKWMVETILIEAIQNGLKRIAGVYDPEQHNADYRARIKAPADKLGIEIDFFTSRKQAEDWIDEHFNNTK